MKNYLNLDEAFANASSVPEAISNQIEILRRSDDTKNIILANKLEAYQKHFCNRQLLAQQRELFNSFYDEIDQNFPDVLFRIEGRRKSFVSTYQKLLNKPENYLMQDSSAFRVILFGKETIDVCYSIANFIIEYTLQNGFIPCTSKNEYSTHSKLPKGIEIPTKSALKQEYLPYVEDYILNPKDNGYQSLQITFMDANGFYFELQIRNIQMHAWAEFGPANHKAYKQNYKQVTFDKSKVNISGYEVMTDENNSITDVLDFVGLEESLEILRRQKTHD